MGKMKAGSEKTNGEVIDSTAIEIPNSTALTTPDAVEEKIGQIAEFAQGDHSADEFKEGIKAADFVAAAAKAMGMEDALKEILHQSIILAYRYGTKAGDKRYGNNTHSGKKADTPKEMKDRSLCRKLAEFPLHQVEEISRKMLDEGRLPSVGKILAKLKDAKKKAPETDETRQKDAFRGLLKAFDLLRQIKDTPPELFQDLGRVMECFGEGFSDQINLDGETMKVGDLVEKTIADRTKPKRGRPRKTPPKDGLFTGIKNFVMNGNTH